MGGPDMAPQTPQTFGAPGFIPGAPLSPSPPNARGAPAKPGHPSILRQALSPPRASTRRRARPHRVQRIPAAGRPVLVAHVRPAAAGFEVGADEREVLRVGRAEPDGDGL